MKYGVNIQVIFRIAADPLFPFQLSAQNRSKVYFFS